MNTLSLSIRDRVRAYVAAFPSAVSGAGGHNQTYAVACALVHGFALSEADALTLLREFNSRCQPAWAERELEHKIKSAMQAAYAKPCGHLLGRNANFVMPGSPTSKLANPQSRKIDPATAAENFLNDFRCGAGDLIAASTCRIPPLICGEHFHKQGAYLIDQLFEPGEFVNIVTHSIVESGKARPGDAGLTLERNEWETRLLDPMPTQPGGAWLRMNPLDGQGITDANVTRFRFALIECDDIPLKLQIALLAKLPLPIAAILASGGRSLHAWVKVNAATMEDYRQTVSRMLALLAKFGVDTANKNPSRMSRLPGVVRQIGATGDGHQRLLYLNPEPKQQAIL